MQKNPTKHMQELCKELGPKYTIQVIDYEQVIYRNFNNGYDVEISGANTSSAQKTVTIHLWSVQKDRRQIEKTIEKVPQHRIGDCVEELYYETSKLAKK